MRLLSALKVGIWGGALKERARKEKEKGRLEKEGGMRRRHEEVRGGERRREEEEEGEGSGSPASSLTRRNAAAQSLPLYAAMFNCLIIF